MHSIEAVEIVGMKVKVKCTCGWKSKAVKDETTAKKQYEAHAESA